MLRVNVQYGPFSPTNSLAEACYSTVLSMSRFCVVLSVVVAALALTSTGQTTSAQSQPPPNAAKGKLKPGAYITSYCVAEAADSSYESGPLHIVYSDASQFMERPAPKQVPANTHCPCCDGNEEGFIDPQLAEDRQTLGWLVDADTCGQNYPLPVALVLFRSGAVLRSIIPERLIWDWMFFQEAKLVGLSLGPSHGAAAPDEYKLYNVDTGRLVDKVVADQDQELKPGAPQWAKKLQDKNGQPPATDPQCKD